jgi:hypothetical protein
MEHSVKNIINLKKLNILNISNFVWAVLLAYTLLVNKLFYQLEINITWLDLKSYSMYS